MARKKRAKEKKVIVIKRLKKTYKTLKKEAGLLASIKSLILREHEYKQALKRVNLSVKKGEILGLIGPNGAGKSTLIKILSGILYPTEGEVKVMDYVPWKQRIEYVKNIGVVFGQKPQLIWDLPPADTFELNRVLYEIPTKEYEERLEELTEVLKLKNITKTPTRDLSLGERMKSKLVAALLHNPSLVFLDEPSIGLDVIAKDRLRELILRYNRRYKTTFIITTHDMQDIERLCKRIVIINRGKIVYDGKMSKIKKLFETKIVNAKFLEPVGKFRLSGCETLKKRKYQLILKINTQQIKLKRVVDYFITHYDVGDLIISDLPIEEVIQKIYEKKDE